MLPEPNPAPTYLVTVAIEDSRSFHRTARSRRSTTDRKSSGRRSIFVICTMDTTRGTWTAIGTPIEVMNHPVEPRIRAASHREVTIIRRLIETGQEANPHASTVLYPHRSPVSFPDISYSICQHQFQPLTPYRTRSAQRTPHRRESELVMSLRESGPTPPENHQHASLCIPTSTQDDASRPALTSLEHEATFTRHSNYRCQHPRRPP